MKTPYNCLHTHGNVLFAARGGKVHTFSLPEGAHIATWKHPELDAAIAAGQEHKKEAETEKMAAEEPAVDADASVVVDEAEPPAKRQKVTEDGQDAKADGQANGKKSKGNKNKDQKNRSKPTPVPDKPVIIQLTTTADGSHLVAVSGNDKAVWVFSHDGDGQLTQLSKRVMPKRPSSITVSSDAQIIVADKFGDVYAIPLIKSDEPYVPAKPAAAALAKPASKPAATVLTVHSKGNRAALAAQQRQLENPGGNNAPGSARAEGPDFEHTLLLGHVSMLTALCLARDSKDRQYILTGDRDEHVRVSRYMPQAHVIHGYCLGHKEFVGDIAIPSSRRDLLVSAGGDEEVYVWDWYNGKLLSKTDILSVAKAVAPQATTAAVSRLITLEYPSDSGPQTFVLAICEGISAIFSWTLLEDNTLARPGVIQLPGKPLDIAAFTSPDSASLAVALHIPDDSAAAGAQSLHKMSLTIDDGRLAVDTLSPVGDGAHAAGEEDASEEEVRSLFYTVEHLRKQRADASGEPEDGDEAPEQQQEDADAAQE